MGVYRYLRHRKVRGKSSLARERRLPAALRVPLAKAGVQPRYFFLLRGLARAERSLLGNVIEICEVERSSSCRLVVQLRRQKYFHGYLPEMIVRNQLQNTGNCLIIAFDLITIVPFISLLRFMTSA